MAPPCVTLRGYDTRAGVDIQAHDRPHQRANRAVWATAGKFCCCFRSVSFRYPGADCDAIKDISVPIRPGEKMALVGANGAGKTTLVKLLTRLYDHTAGEFTVNGHDLRTLDLQRYYRQLGVIFQDFARYSLTAR